MSEKPYCIRVRVLDGKPRDIKALNKLKSNQLGMPHLDIINAKDGIELIICAAKETHLAQVREKLRAAGLEEIEGVIPLSQRPRPRRLHLEACVKAALNNATRRKADGKSLIAGHQRNQTFVKSHTALSPYPIISKAPLPSGTTERAARGGFRGDSL